MKRYLLLVLMLLLALPALAAPQVLTGTFVGIEMGDYAHLLVKDQNGEERSFFVSNDKSFMPFIENPEKYVGKKVQVTWHLVKKHIPEAGGEMELEEATSIKLL